jgi:hypothetical protein
MLKPGIHGWINFQCQKGDESQEGIFRPNCVG